MSKLQVVVDQIRQDAKRIANPTANLVQGVLAQMGYIGIWKLRFKQRFKQKSNNKFSVARTDSNLHAVIVRVKCGDNSTSWECALYPARGYCLEEVADKLTAFDKNGRLLPAVERYMPEVYEKHYFDPHEVSSNSILHPEKPKVAPQQSEEPEPKIEISQKKPYDLLKEMLDKKQTIFYTETRQNLLNQGFTEQEINDAVDDLHLVKSRYGFGGKHILKIGSPTKKESPINSTLYIDLNTKDFSNKEVLLNALKALIDTQKNKFIKPKFHAIIRERLGLNRFDDNKSMMYTICKSLYKMGFYEREDYNCGTIKHYILTENAYQFVKSFDKILEKNTIENVIAENKINLPDAQDQLQNIILENENVLNDLLNNQEESESLINASTKEIAQLANKKIELEKIVESLMTELEKYDNELNDVKRQIDSSIELKAEQTVRLTLTKAKIKTILEKGE